MELKKINKLLENLENFDKKQVEFIRSEKGYIGIPENDSEGYMGEYNELISFYKIINEDELYLKITYQTDSYNDNRRVIGIQFVKPTKKEIIAYEKI